MGWGWKHLSPWKRLCHTWLIRCRGAVLDPMLGLLLTMGVLSYVSVFLFPLWETNMGCGLHRKEVHCGGSATGLPV